MHRGILAAIGALLWFIGLGIPLPPLGAAYLPTNYILPLVGTVLFVPAIASRS